MTMRIAMVAGEASGDILGAGLIKAIKKNHPDAEFYGIGGPLMIAEGFNTWYPMERLSVMGLVEVLGRLFELLKIRKNLTQRLTDDKPDVFIGIDAPDFNLTLETNLKSSGIKTVHYVSPSVWAWREKRVIKIAKAVDLILCLFPFEVDFYSKHNVKAVCVGHTLADSIPVVCDSLAAKEKLNLNTARPVVALLPGSRQGEVSRLGDLFLQAAEQIQEVIPHIQYVIPAANSARKEQLVEMLKAVPQLDVKLLDGQSQDAMAAADSILLASGTAALEGMLFKKPMVVSYKLNALTAFFVRRMLKLPYVSLPNMLAGRELVPELLQEDATPENLTAAMLDHLQDKQAAAELNAEYTSIHLRLKRNADEASALAVIELIGVEQSTNVEQGEHHDS